MLWEAAAGRRLWQDLAEAAIVGRLVSGPALPPPLGPSPLPPGLLRVCRRALALDPRERYGSAVDFRADLLPLVKRSPEAVARQLGQLVSGAFAEERAAMEAIARRGIEAELTASRELSVEAGPPPSATLTESALRPFEAAPRRRAPERGAVGLARLAGLGLLAVTIGFGTIRVLSRPTVPAPPAPALAAPSQPTFEPTLPRVDPPIPDVSAPTVVAEPVQITPPARPRRHRRAAAQPVAAPTPAPASFEQPMAPPARSRPRPLDVDNPYKP
jgi:serine/threonine-protein kinase